MLRLQLMEVKSGDLLGTQTIRVGEMYAGRHDADAANVWNALNPIEKVQVLRRMVEQHVARVMPQLVQPR